MAEYRNIYFIGIGGIGMSAIARYYNARGFKVSGYDKTPSPLTHALEQEGIEVHYEDNISFIPKDTESTLVVYTPAIPKDMGELVYVQEKGYRVIKRSRMLGEITDGQRCMAVAGTHGKTTTSTFLSHIFTDTGEGCSAFLGGISKNYGSNLLIHGNDVVVVEADEFDRSFLQLYPEIAVITSMDADHLDIYSDIKNMHEAFKAFAGQVSGTVITKIGLPVTSEDTKANILRYSYDDPAADFYASDIKVDECGYFTFSLHWPGGTIENCKVGIPGWVNVENAVAAVASMWCAAKRRGEALDLDLLRKGLREYQGVKRRFEFYVNTPRQVYMDDYAHHPEELEATITSVRKMFPGRKLTAVFQPHLYTRTRDFAVEFAEVLSEADKVVMVPIYPARELPIEGVTSELIGKDITAEWELVERDSVAEYLKSEQTDVTVSFGAGNIDVVCGEIAKTLAAKITR